MESNYPQSSNDAASSSSSQRRSKSEFPIKVYAMLELADNIFEFAQSASWLPHGRAFRIHNKVKFMEEVVPLFFNQTKIRSFNRQLHLWGFHRIGRGSDQVWCHENFLRGKPECMKNMIRTKIKGNNSVIGQDVRVPNFDALPPLPICNKLPLDVLEVMENAILKMPTSTQSAPCGANVSSMQSLPLNVETVSPTSDPTSVLSVGYSPQSNNLPVDYSSQSNTLPVDYSSQSAQLPTYAPPPFSRRVSNESPPLSYQELPQQFNNTMPMTQSSLQEPCQMEPNCLLSNDLNLYSGKSQSNNLNLYSVQSQNINFGDFEPLSVMSNDEPCDEFASFIEGAIQQIQ